MASKLRSAAAGAIAATTWGLLEPLDQRILRCDYSDIAVLEAMRGNIDEARSLLGRAQARRVELGDEVGIAFGAEEGWFIETCAGDLGAAERTIREGCERFEAMGEKGWLSTLAGRLARTLSSLGRYDEAEEWSRRSEELGDADMDACSRAAQSPRGRWVIAVCCSRPEIAGKVLASLRSLKLRASNGNVSGEHPR